MTLQHLPSQPTPFIGREVELAEIARLVTNPTCRLLTLVGPGGIGKTRLSLEVARQQDAFPDGVYFVALQPLIAPDFIIPAIAEVLDFQFYPDREQTQQLFDFLHEKSLLLVLDNFEHLLDGAGLVSDLLAYTQAVKILATSRERLNLVEEWALDMQGLTFPASEAEGEIGGYSAVALFLQCAQRANVGFTLTDAQKPAVTRICHLVGGMPLGIELAAAWVRALSCEEIAAEIERSMDILATPARNVPPRHRNMRAVLEHSWNLLTEAERDVFKKLSVFRGGFRKEAAKVLADATLQILSALADKSLLRVDANGRYDLHELLRQYAQEKLELTPDVYEQTLNLHSAFYAEFMGQRQDQVRGSELTPVLREIENELENIRTAWERSTTQHRTTEVENYLWTLFLFHESQGWIFEGEEAFAKAVQAFEGSALDHESERMLGLLLGRQAFFSVRLGYYEKGKALLLKSLAILRPLEARLEMVASLLGLGAVCTYLGEYIEADTALQEGTAICREGNSPFELAWALNNQAKLLRTQGYFERAKPIIQEGITLCREYGIFDILSESLTEYGQIMEGLAHYPEARQAYQDAMTIEAFPFSLIRANSTLFLGRIARTLGQDDEAAVYYHKALEISKLIRSFRWKLDVLLGMTELLMRQGDKERDVERLALIVHHPASLGETRNKAQSLLDNLQLELSAEAFATSQERGKAAKLDDALEAIYETPLFSRLRAYGSNFHDAAPKQRSSVSLNRVAHALTEREREILHLMAQGISNRDIAAQLFLSVGTVKWYGSQICSKLQVQNRVQAIARARELNILL